MVLVLITAIPRNYDQIYWRESDAWPYWLFAPLIFSLFSGTFLFGFIYFGFIRGWLDDPRSVPVRQQWRRFMALFWMTAPIAWLYAIPVERFLDPYHAAMANLGLLLGVAGWRVCLMARVFSVLQPVQFSLSLGWVLAPACFEVLVVAFCGGLAIALGGMGGIQYSPEDSFMITAANVAFYGAIVLLGVVAILLVRAERRFVARPLPELAPGRLPVVGLAIVVTVWFVISIPAQIEQYRFVAHVALLRARDYRGALNYLARHRRTDFPASRRIEPSPFELFSRREFPETLANLRATDPQWVKRLYLDYLRVVFSDPWLRINADEMLKVLGALERLPEGKEWVDRNRERFKSLKPLLAAPRDDATSKKPDDSVVQIEMMLRNLGIDPETLK